MILKSKNQPLQTSQVQIKMNFRGRGCFRSDACSKIKVTKERHKFSKRLKWMLCEAVAYFVALVSNEKSRLCGGHAVLTLRTKALRLPRTYHHMHFLLIKI